MTQEQQLIFDELDGLCGEPLDGSGFETEDHDPEFVDDDSGDNAEGRS